MRLLVALAVTVSAALALGLAAPNPAIACTGCATSFREFVGATDSLVLARYRGRVGQLSIFDVIDVLKGPPAHTLRLKMRNKLGQHPLPGTRWLLTPARGVSMDLFRVDPDGTVTNLDQGEGIVESPSTLAGWYRALGLRPPDTAAVAGPPASPSPVDEPAIPVGLLIAGALAGGAITLRRQSRRANPPSSAPARPLG